jgi:glycosyltransferase involved in cell wall biosynthesis
MNFEVSVIIPVYNAAQYVEQAVNSALQQAETGEIILIEDGSTDNSLEVCKILNDKYEKVVLYTHENNDNLGAGASRNVGLQNAIMPYIAFLDADDFFLENRFRETRKVFIENNADGVYEGLGTVYESEESKVKYLRAGNPDFTSMTKIINPKDLFYNLVLIENGYFSIDALTIKKSVVFEKNIFFDESLRQKEDTDFIYRLSLEALLFPGNIHNAVAMRKVHLKNSILNKLDEQKLSGSLFYNKWTKIAEENSFKRQVNFRIIKNQISFNVKFYSNKWLNRINLFKGLALLLAKRPNLIRKIIF